MGGVFGALKTLGALVDGHCGLERRRLIPSFMISIIIITRRGLITEYLSRLYPVYRSKGISEVTLPS
jgi:hypothetical protein